MTISHQMAGMSASQKRRFLVSMARKPNGVQRKTCLSEIQALRKLRDRIRVHYCSEPRLELATDERCCALPGTRCRCDRCLQLAIEWPGPYLMAARGEDGMRVMVSYECYLHSQCDEFLVALPSSSSIVRFK